MAFSGRPIWEVRTTGSDTNGGAFIGSAGSDYSQQNSPQYSGTDLEVNASNNLQVKSTTAGSPVAADVGNVICISAGTFWTTGWYEIQSQDGTWWTLDRSPNTAGSTGGTFAVGGAVASPGVAASVANSLYTGSNLRGKIYIESGTYPITSAGSITSNPVSGCSINYGAFLNIYGYDSTNGRNNKPASYPILQSQSGYTGRVYYGHYSGNASYNFGKIVWLELDGNGLPSSGTPVCQTPSEAWECTIKGPKGGGCASGGSYWHCHIDATGMNAYQTAMTGTAYYSFIASNSYRTFAVFNGSALFCVIRGGTSSYPVVRMARHTRLIGCRVHSWSGPALLDSGSFSHHQTIMNNIFVGTGTQNLFSSAPTVTANGTIFRNNYYYGCTNQGISGMTNDVVLENPIALSQDPFTDSANQDYTLDPTGADYTTILSANDSGLAVPNTTVGPRVSSFTENVGGGSTVQTMASIERLK